MKTYDLYGCRVVITGASGGIGAALSLLLVKKYGCRVLGLARNREKLASVAEAAGSGFIYRVCDVTDARDREYVASHILGADILINNAGMLPRFRRAETYSHNEISSLTELNFTAAADMTSLLMPALKGSRRGAVVNISSADAYCPIAGTSVYSASKAALAAYTVSLRCENPDMYVAAVYPGFVRTGLFSSNDFGSQKDFIMSFAMTPERLAAAVAACMEKRREDIVAGFDAYAMLVGAELLGTRAAKAAGAALKLAHIDLFSEVFGYGNK